MQNFENLNPANTFWDKYYQVFANVDTEAPRFLEFERWWGGYFLMNREEIEWITQNLFVGNKLWSGAVKAGPSKGFDLRDIKVPIVLFASVGDNITPPQQAFNWVADVYGSTEEIKARGQVIVGLMHEDVGHLGIFVSGKVAKKEGTQIASVLKSIEALPPGLYGMQIAEQKDRSGKPAYEVSFVELRLEDIVARLNRFKRADERPFEAVKAVSEFNQRAYELFGRPLVQGAVERVRREALARVSPAAFAALGDLRPQSRAVVARAGCAGGEGTAPGARAGRSGAQARVGGIGADERFARLLSRHCATRRRSHLLPDLRQPVRVLPRRRTGTRTDHAAGDDPRELPFVKEALASIDKGGYAEALARVAFLMAHEDEPLPLSRLQLAHDLIDEYRDLLPELPPDEAAPYRRRAGDHRALRAGKGSRDAACAARRPEGPRIGC